MGGNGTFGVFARETSIVAITPGSGVKNAGTNGLWCRRASTANANNSVFTGASGDANVVAVENSIINMRDADVSGALGIHGVWAVTGSFIIARDATISNCAQEGLRADPGSIAYAAGSDVSGAGLDGYVVSVRSRPSSLRCPLRLRIRALA
jgi:hypothetical protein